MVNVLVRRNKSVITSVSSGKRLGARDDRETRMGTSLPDAEALRASLPEGLPERAQVAVERGREFLAWALTDVFDWNPQYLKELRGILNIIEVVVSLLIVSMLGNVCQNQATMINEEIGGFYCRNTDTFLFSIGMASLLGSTLHLLCCALSKKTEDRLWGTSYVS
ncbi:MARVEL domain-containing protein [Trichonephila inaurata madagascariensis]|uniref:MARVEL domain-containing protein n=1 Tax=Trichonephila inaurata madagascariensis TaxID=2747483 RepID=A0A8X6YZ07_9ARAC|nr:MARVEL domain-containing protein [Trichonephila inaurata madagascariensis]